MPGSGFFLRSPRESGDVSASASCKSVSQARQSSSRHGRRSQRSGHGKGGSSASSGGDRRLRRKLGGSHKHHPPHVCCFPSHQRPSAILLDPFPNARINALCVAGLSTVVTAHRTGLRLYRERQLPVVTPPTVLSESASPSTVNNLTGRLTNSTAVAGVPPSVGSHSGGEGTGVFELIETRQQFELRDSYMCVAMQTFLANGSVYLSKWSRYFCVASGNDRVVHSVSVLSSGAHFCLGHTKHHTNKVVCMQCTHVALEPCHPLSLTPAVVSVDEVGAVALFDVEREATAVLERAPLWFRQVEALSREQRGAEGGGEPTVRMGDSRAHADGNRQRVPLPQQRLTPEEEDCVVDTMERVSASERVVYHLEHGVATRVALVGPCLELCNRCHNAFSQLTASSRGYKLVSVYLSSRAQDLPADAAQQKEGGSRDSTGTAELNVVLLRVLWGPRRAFVLEELHLVREAAPTDVCDAGIAMNAPPYQVGAPMTLLLARPSLEMWGLSGCTGELIETHRMYTYYDGAHRGGCRAASEFFLHWIPLGRHRLAVENGVHGEEEMSWLCTAAVTSDGTVLLLGSAPTPVGRCGVGSVDPLAAPHVVHHAPAADQIERTVEFFTDADLEAWLDDISVPDSQCSSQPERKHCFSTTAAPVPQNEEVLTAGNVPRDTEDQEHSVAPSHNNVSFPYTVLMGLYSPKRSHKKHLHDGVSSHSTGLVSLLPDWRSNRLLLFREDHETLLSVPLPFAERVGTLTDTKEFDRDTCEVGDGSAKHFVAAKVSDGPLSSPSASSKQHATPGEAQESGVAQYLKGATTRVATAASQGWSTSIQRWAPSAPSYFTYFDSSRRIDTEGQSAPHHPLSEKPPAPAPESCAATLLADTAATRVSTAVVTDSEGPRPFFSFTRPLMSALFHLTGEDEPPVSSAIVKAALEEKTMPSVKSTEKVSGIALSSVPIEHQSGGVARLLSSAVSSRAASVSIQRSVSAHHTHRPHSRHHQRHNSARENSAAGSLHPPSTLMSSHGNRRSPASSAALPHTQTIQEESAARASYMAAQMTLLREQSEMQRDSRGSASGLTVDDAAQNPTRATERGQYALPHLIEVGEPLARNALLYAWKDGHNDLYIRFSVERDELQQGKGGGEVDTHMEALSLKGENSPVFRHPSRRNRRASDAHLSFCWPADVENGVHSMGFLSKYNLNVLKRATAEGDGSCFDFQAYFTTLQVPPHVLDLHERDKCHFELEDLRLQQAKDLAALQPYNIVTIFQNEERADVASAEWCLHATFPYDDALDGHVVDLQQLNRDAVGGRSTTAAVEWRWADASETEAWYQVHNPKRDSRHRLRSLMKDLKDWEVGPWTYATRWPSREEEIREGRGFTWSASESPEHRCRRRQLSRLRVSVAELKQQQELMVSHQRELDMLREELRL